MEPTPVPDALPEDLPGGEPPAAPESPYRNLLVPLVVVPALIVMVLVLVWVLFGAIAGSEAGPGENLDRMLHGGANEREQAALLLVSQLQRHLEDEREGREPEWEIDASFLPELRKAWQDLEPDEVRFRYIVAVLLARLGDADGLERLLSLLRTPPELDEGAEIRFLVLSQLGALGPELAPAERDRAVAAVVPFLDHEDEGLRTLAAAALQGLGGPAARAALVESLDDPSLSVRGSAALSLSQLGDPAGADVLRELVDPDTYEAERRLDPRDWRRGDDVSRSRARAVRALARLGRPEDRALLERVAEEEEDLNVREAALRALRDGGDG